MRLVGRLAGIVAAVALCLALLSGASGAPVAAAGTWGRAVEVPGTAALNTAGAAGISSVSCASPGNCSAGGSYATTPFCRVSYTCHYQAFVVSQVRGTWRKAQEVPGTAVLDKGRDASVDSVSCGSAGNCAAGGFYQDRSGRRQAFFVSQVRGTWRKAQEVPGTAALNLGGSAQVTSVSCVSAGNCAAVGIYKDSAGHEQAFVVTESHGALGAAAEVPGTAALNKGGSAQVTSVSCASAGNCAAGGSYTGGSGEVQAFVVTETGGAWGTAVEVPGTAALNTGGYAKVTSVSCGSAGNCSAVGLYDPSTIDQLCCNQGFVVSQVHGTWSTASRIPGIVTLGGRGEDSQLLALSCASAGNCSAGGIYDTNGYDEGCCGQAFVLTQTNGHWGNALRVPGTAVLNSGDDGGVSAVSCASAGNCAAVGSYGVGTFGNKVYDNEVFVVSQVHGVWGKAREVPGTAALNKGHQDTIASVDCAAPGRCTAVGGYWGSASYAPGSHHGEVFVVSEG